MEPQNNNTDQDNGSPSKQKPKSPTQQSSTNPSFTALPGADRLNYHSQERNYLSQFYNQPLVATLTGFSHVANFVRNPYELINNVDGFVRHTGSNANGRRYPRSSENFARTLNQNRQSAGTTGSLREMDTFVACSQDLSPTSSPKDHQNKRKNTDGTSGASQSPLPALPPIEASTKRGRLEPLTIEEYENRYRLSATDLELVERVFAGSMTCNQLRAALWPYLFGLVIHRGKFEKIQGPDGKEAYLFIDHEANNPRWRELQKLYDLYREQWLAIIPDQELRFSAFRERKSLIERDVIRCDRLHPFYAEEPQNLTKLTNLLMTYMMYDFDIGYVQGMSDLAGPILYMYNGDLVKSFWVFVEVMKLFRRNFELTQKTIHFQLNCLYELIKCTDPVFAEYLKENESSNCFFAFRAIVCQFKRELMKEEGENDYSKVLFLWDTIWCAKRRTTLQEEMDALNEGQGDMAIDILDSKSDGKMKHEERSEDKPVTQQPLNPADSPFVTMDPNQSDTLRHTLTETEIFVLALCLSMIRRERDIIMANNMDGTDIHLHFIDPKLASDLNGFIEHAINIYSYLKKDFDITKLTMPRVEPDPSDVNPEASPTSADGYDSLSDFLIINGASGT